VRRVEVALGRAATEAASASGARSPIDMLRMTRAVRREKLDVFFSPTVYTYFPLPPGLSALATIHDCIAERYPELTLPSRRARLFWSAKVGLARRQARMILTVSEYSARDIERVMRVPRERIRVAVEAPSASYAPCDSPLEIARAARRAGLPDGARWFTYVGGFNPHKHVDLIVRAHAALARDWPHPLHLLLVGPTSEDVFHGDHGRIRRGIEALGTGDLVHWTGYVADEELRFLHAGAVALVLPSQCEGFGLPAVEAAACGAPVIATTESPLPELLEGGGIFVAPGDLAALASAMRTLLADGATRERMAERALARARALTWPRAAQAALDALRECAR
jgi:glycosyltransferase involved in cell wall biosynthesis